LSTLLKLENVFYTPKDIALFNKSRKHDPILKEISFELKRGEVLGIVGESGSGKTTLIKVISGILKHEKGSIIFNSKAQNHKSSPIQILFQNSNELINPLRRVGSILKESFPSKNKLEEICALLGIPENYFDKTGYQLSGGERQRVGLARILSVEPELLILDEPFSAQDPESQVNFLEIFKNIKEKLGLTIICISHDLNLLKEFADSIIVLFAGKIMEFGKVEEIINWHKHPYTKFLFDAFNYSLKRSDFGDNNSTRLGINGCPYYNRCNRKADRCLDFVEEIKTNELKTFCNYPLGL